MAVVAAAAACCWCRGVLLLRGVVFRSAACYIFMRAYHTYMCRCQQRQQQQQRNQQLQQLQQPGAPLELHVLAAAVVAVAAACCWRCSVLLRVAALRNAVWCILWPTYPLPPLVCGCSFWRKAQCVLFFCTGFPLVLQML